MWQSGDRPKSPYSTSDFVFRRIAVLKAYHSRFQAQHRRLVFAEVCKIFGFVENTEQVGKVESVVTQETRVSQNSLTILANTRPITF